ncbi:hypothetical protein COW36_13170 [bacterium (Candidatus Blackallbacteria) CG17_big_fil_post_rev_8_21_14_2_50_48_46]|uniref:Uncharacterized protein n=1 Tax=bacterium (Candidatus Blackallbacteria) CG17_big_fil_post_rev_8_21_14_2_50_48_46 TaxID=2014261 RepID=A0A2M7G4C9_9BACT|nr:MAG: hypothetical protein COW64_02100 [bacterium (Candidatus Blackallbacteria) CG18_big_fil_WC_8_21_14_2_50_49_26]PIW16710.1 MAG: hypothetical protein COW36_13170 [bacterium (Candidatus Blackallbacteria) CG17_big_fil_post_rev_8_21_14_2_50_48_46]PIW46216.1 MAG: hypothetical protein COW20_18420 [bacterium (Candidatus Blackallbacteria) CG13_big_fil_rev_8_21_14_2_50_49_14]
MSHFILQTQLTPHTLLEAFPQLKAQNPGFVRAWLSPNGREILLEVELDLGDELRTEYLSLQRQSSGDLIFHLLSGGEEIPFKALSDTLQRLLNWLLSLEPHAHVVRHTFGQYVTLPATSLHGS